MLVCTVDQLTDIQNNVVIKRSIIYFFILFYPFFSVAVWLEDSKKLQFLSDQLSRYSDVYHKLLYFHVFIEHNSIFPGYSSSSYLQSCWIFVEYTCLSLWAAIQRQGSILAWIVILSVYGADTIAEVKYLLSPFLCWSLDLWSQLLGFITILIYMQ